MHDVVTVVLVQHTNVTTTAAVAVSCGEPIVNVSDAVTTTTHSGVTAPQ